MKYIVEHMEDSIFEWCELEYIRMLEEVGVGNLYFSNVSENIVKHPPLSLERAIFTTANILDMGIDLSKVVLLDPAASEPLTPEDGEKYEFLLFGGILGDDPPRDRTGELRKHGFATRHLGPVQMTTDTAVAVSQLVMKGKRLEDIPFIDRPEIPITKYETVTMPFRYILGEDGNPIIARGMKKLLLEDEYI